MERAVRVLVMAHAFDGTFANRAVASPSFALALRPQLRGTSKSIAFVSGFFVCAGRDAKLTEILHGIPEFKDELLRASTERLGDECVSLLEFHYPELDRTQHMIEHLRVLASDEDWPEDGSQIYRFLGAISSEIASFGDSMTKAMKFHTDGNLATVMQRFIIEYPELRIRATAPTFILSCIASAAPDIAPEYLRLTVVPIIARLRMSLDNIRTNLRQVMSALYHRQTPNGDDLERMMAIFNETRASVVNAAVVGLDPCARRMLEEMPEGRETLDGLAEIVEELVLTFVTDEEGKVFHLSHMANTLQILRSRTGKVLFVDEDLYREYIKLAIMVKEEIMARKKMLSTGRIRSL
ncbi:hypothetical protein BC828DRAFT_171972 [Blastocladiella britannica]|nr:hypothetical protein BC828DRAFT_171972 [Blastocladiella britannica]